MTVLATRLAYPFTTTAVVTATTVQASSLAIARAVAEPAAGTMMALGGRSSVNDGGQGTFVWDATSTAADDGALTIAVSGVTTGRWKRVYTGPIDVRWFGATGDGTTDDTTAIQNAIDAARRAVYGDRLGATVWLPEGAYRITSTLKIENVLGLQFRGAGGGTVIRWDGPAWTASAYTAAIEINSCQFCCVRDFNFDVLNGKRLSRFANIKSLVGGTYVSSRNRIEGITCLSNGTVDDGVVIGGGLDSNNDFHVIKDCTFAGMRRYGVRILSTATQAYDITCHDVFITGWTWYTTTGNVALNGTITNIPANTFSAEDVGQMIEIVGANYANDTARTYIVSVDSSTQITVGNGTSIYHALTGGTIRYGSQAAYCASAGNIRARGGGVGSFLDADLLLGVIGSSPHYFHGINSEGSRRLLRGIQNTGGRATVLHGIRFAGDAGLLNSEYPRPYEAILMENGGPLVLRECSIGDVYAAFDMRISFKSPGTNYAWYRFSLENCWIAATTATTAADLFTQWPPTSVVNSSWSNGVTVHRIGEVERDHGSKSGATTIPLIWSANKVTVTNNITFTFAALPEGSGTRTRLHLVHSGGTHTVTFPTLTVVGSAFSHTGNDWFEFWTDGTTLWGKQL